MSNLIINANSIYDRVIRIGRQTENLVSSITFNVNMWIDEYGAGECVLNVKRNGDGSAYLVPMTIADGMTTWTITDTDTAKKGRGEIQLTYIVGEKVKTSPIFTISCGESLIGDGEPPSGYEDWSTELNRMTAEVEAAKTSADQSAQTATAKATEAEQSATTASGFANNASASATSASTSAQAAAQSAEQAASSASDVEASAQAASQSAQSAESAKQAAQTAESNAQGFAQTASAKAAEAAESAVQAQGSVTDAQAEVTRASAEADRAKTYADRAAEVELEIPTKVSELENDAGYLTEHQSLADYIRKDALYNMLPVDSANGAVVSFPDGADDVPLKSLVVGIDPVQEGSGDPTPENIRRISGRTAANITTCGKNILMNTVTSRTSNGVTYVKNTDGTITANGTATGGNGRCDVFNVNNPPKSLLDALSGKKLAGCPEGGAYNTYRIQFVINGSIVCIDNGTGVTIPDLSQYYGATNMYIDASVRTGYTAENLVFKPMISADAAYGVYEPYSGESIAVAFPSEAGTVYGGTLDVTNGVLTVDKAIVNLGSLTWYALQVAGENIFQVQYLLFPTGTEGEPSKAWCEAFKVMPYGRNASYLTYDNILWPSINGSFLARCSKYTDVDLFKEAMNGVYLVYPMKTPQTFQLTPTEVKSLFGQNNIWADTGDTSVEYRADIQKWVEKKLSTQ